MKTGTPSLLTLIKLREGQLSPAAGVTVREQLAADSKLLRRWKLLSQVAEQKLELESTFEKSVFNAELIAAYVEERMPPEKQKAFESTCWQERALIREVLAAYQADRFEESATAIPEKYSQQVMQTTQRMSKFIHQELRKSEELDSPVSYLGSIEDHEQPVVSQPPAEQVRLEKSSDLPFYSYSAIKHQKLIYGVVVVLLMVLPAYVIWNRQSKEVEENSIVVSPENKQMPVPVVPIQTNQRDSVPEMVVVPTDPHRGKRPLISPAVDHKLQSPPVVAQKPEMAGLQLADTFSLDWSELVGIAGIRNDTRSNWQGILAAGQEPHLKAGSQFELRTLPLSWMQAKFSLGEKGAQSEFVLDADTEVELMLKRANQSTAHGLQIVLDLNLHSGQIAFSQLYAGTVIHYHTQSRDWLLEIQQDDSAIAFVQQEPGQSELKVFSGTLRLSDTTSREELTLKSEQMLKLKAERISVPLKLSGNQRWRTGPAKSFPLNSTFVAELNHSEDLLAALMQISPDRSKIEQQSGVNLGIALDPLSAVLQATTSRSELQRTAAIDWLLTTKDNANLIAVWKQIAQNTGENPASPAIQTWFQVARGEIPAGQTLLADLSAGLDARQPLFVRQSSIHFLRQLTRQPLAEYDPDSPSPVAINSIRQKLRRLTGTKNRSGGNTPRRQQ